MKRFQGMMPSSEIEVEKRFKDSHGLKISIQAGPHGWSIIYADSSSKYKDVDSTTDDNFKTAYDVATKDLGTLSAVGDEGYAECESYNEG